MEIKCFKQSWQPVARKTNILRMSKCTYTALMRFLSNLYPSYRGEYNEKRKQKN